MHSSHPRPAGPRTIPRSISPALFVASSPPAPPPSTSNNQTVSSSFQAPAQTLHRSPTPSRLQIPGIARPRPTTPRVLPPITIPIANGTTHDRSDDASPVVTNAAFCGGYYGGPTNASLALDGQSPDDGGVTITPFARAATPRPVEPIADLRQTLESLRRATDQSSGSQQAPQRLSSDDDGITWDTSEWSDDRLEELDRLGEGAGGAVHKVKDKQTGMVMARKTIATRESPMKQLLRELNISASAIHPNIIVFHGAYISPSSSEVKILMEFCEGGSLEAVGKRIKERGGRVGEKVAGRLAEGVLKGLAYLHTKNTIHRDIKPSNILLSREGVVKLCDFGVSGELVRSMADTFTGTSFYMAPERINGDMYTIRSDVWSTGIALLELVQNKFPFPNDVGPIDLIMHITRSPPPQLTDEEGVHWTDTMKDFIKQALIVDGNVRPTPEALLKHPWIMGIMQQEINMARWIREVWSWPKPRKTKDSASRPSSSRAENSDPPRPDSPT